MVFALLYADMMLGQHSWLLDKMILIWDIGKSHPNGCLWQQPFLCAGQWIVLSQQRGKNNSGKCGACSYFQPPTKWKPVWKIQSIIFGSMLGVTHGYIAHLDCNEHVRAHLVVVTQSCQWTGAR